MAPVDKGKEEGMVELGNLNKLSACLIRDLIGCIERMGNTAQLGETLLTCIWSLHGCGSFLVMGQDTWHFPCLCRKYLWGWGQWKAAAELLCKCFRPWQGEKVSRGDQRAALGELWVQKALQPLNWYSFPYPFTSPASFQSQANSWIHSAPFLRSTESIFQGFCHFTLPF